MRLVLANESFHNLSPPRLSRVSIVATIENNTNNILKSIALNFLSHLSCMPSQIGSSVYLFLTTVYFPGGTAGGSKVLQAK
jgi:hypothetical protein